MNRCCLATLLIILCCTVAARGQTRPATRPCSFVIGMYAVPGEPSDFEAVKTIGVTHVHTYTLGGATPDRLERAQRYLDLARQHGLKVMFDLNGKSLLAEPDGLDHLRLIARRFESHPALAMWYLYDEPVAAVPVEKLRAYYDELKKLTPQVPVATCLNHAEGWYDYAAGTDVILNDFYPIRGGAFPDANLQIVTTFTREALHSGRQVMPVLQCFNWAVFAPKGATTYRSVPVSELRSPDERELRYMIYANVAQGVDGVFFYSYLRGKQSDPKWFAQTFAPTIHELRTFIDEISSAHTSRKIFRVSADFDIYATLWENENDRWLIVANGQPRERNLPLTLERKIRFARLQPIGATRDTGAVVQNGRVTVAARPWEVFVWKFIVNASPQPAEKSR
jgi:hypothetical protein